MTRLIKTTLTAMNSDLLDHQLKTALTTSVCYGVQSDNTGIYIILTDNVTQQQIDAALTVANEHDAAAKTPEQQADIDGRVSLTDWKDKVDTALTDMQDKLATFRSGSTLQNAAPLLVEVSQDMILLLKAVKYLARKV